MIKRFVTIAVLILLAAYVWDIPSTISASMARPADLDVPYESTPPEVVDEMLKLAKVTKTDLVYDLGCGDGRIVIAAAQKYGARGVGIDIDPARILEAEANAQKAGLTDKITFIEKNLFEAELTDATVVALYLNYDVNLKLRPKLQKELRPGSRVVSSTFDMGDWKPDRTSLISGRNIYCWIIRGS